MIYFLNFIEKVTKLESTLPGRFTKLDFHISEHEIFKAIFSLKNRKSAGMGLCNEMFKSVQSFIVQCLHKLYNVNAVLLSG